MELLNKSQPPVLITNIEVMQLLAERVMERKEEEQKQIEELDRKEAEEEAVEAAMLLASGNYDNTINNNNNNDDGDNNNDSADREEEKKKKQKEKKKKKLLASRKNSKLRHRDWIEENVLEYLKSTPCANTDYNQLPTLIKKLKGKTKDGGFGLTSAESLQILNYMPTESVDIHIMVDDLQSRIVPEERQEELLNTIREYLIIPPQEEEEAVDETMEEEDNPKHDDNTMDVEEGIVGAL